MGGGRDGAERSDEAKTDTATSPAPKKTPAPKPEPLTKQELVEEADAICVHSQETFKATHGNFPTARTKRTSLLGILSGIFS